jgi:hypothetical protein
MGKINLHYSNMRFHTERLAVLCVSVSKSVEDFDSALARL